MKISTWWLIAGVILTVGGVAALLNPFAATLTATLIVAWAFLLGGILQLVSGILHSGQGGGRLWTIVWGAVSICLGISLLGDPLSGTLTLTMAAGILIIVAGSARVIFALSVRGTRAFAPLLLLGLAGIVLGGMVLYYFPASASSLLGTLLAVELLFSGIGMISAFLLLGSTKSGN